MRRRDLILGGSAAIASPPLAQAQKPRLPIIGILGFGQPDDPAIRLNLAGLRRGLSEAGLVEGKDYAFDDRWAHGDEARLPVLAAGLVARGVDVIVTEGGIPTSLAAKAATTTIPVVFHTADAIADGIVGNLARPGGNLTGVSLFAPELLSKQFELLREVAPQVRTIAVLSVPSTQISDESVGQIEAAASPKAIQIRVIKADSGAAIDAAFAALPRSGVGMVVRANATFVNRIVPLAARYEIPAVYHQRAYVEAGGLLSYGVSFPALYVIKGRYAAEILKGAKPADLPVQQPTKFELVINRKTVKALGLRVPPLLLAQADEVIE